MGRPPLTRLSLLDDDHEQEHERGGAGAGRDVRDGDRHEARDVPEMGTGRWHIVETGCASVLGVRYDTTRTSGITLVNLADEEVQVQPRAFEELEHLGHILGDSRYDRGDVGWCACRRRLPVAAGPPRF